METGSQTLTTYYAKRIIGDTAAANATAALLQTGANIATNTWILDRTNRANTYGIKYLFDNTTNGTADKIEFYGGQQANNADVPSAWVQLDTGDLYVLGNVGIGHAPDTYKLYVNGTSHFTGNMSFAAIGTTGTSPSISWSGSTDGASIYYTAASSDAGVLVVNMTDDANARISLRTQGTERIGIDSNGTYVNTQLQRAGKSVSWYQGRTTAITKTTSYSGYDAILSMKTTAGDWSLGVYTDNICYLTYILDSNYSANTNTVTKQFYFKPDGTIGGDSFTGNAATATEGKWLMNRGGSTVTIADSSWGIQKTPSGFTNRQTVWHQKWTQSGITYTPSGGSATTLTDSGDLKFWLASSNTSNALTLNMQIDGLIYAAGGFQGNLTGNVTGNVTGNCSGSSGSCTGNAATATALTSNAGSTTSPIYFTNGKPSACNQPKSGAWYSSVPMIGSDGVMEVGKYIDFHDGNTITADYSVRITASSTGLTLGGTTSGTFSGNLTGNVTGNCSGSSGSCTGNAATCTTANGLASLVTSSRANHSADTGVIVQNTDSTNPLKLGYIIGNSGNGGIYDFTHGVWKVQIAPNGTTTFNGNAATATKATQDSDGNAINSTYLKKSGGTMTGALHFANGTLNNVGDDCAMGDQNAAGAFCLKGLNGATNIRFIQYGGTAAGTLTWNGSNFAFSAPATATRLHATSDTDAVAGSVANVALITGPHTGTHIEYDGNELIAKSNASTKSSLYFNENCYVDSAGKLYNAVWNDFAEYRSSEITEPGRVVISDGSGQVVMSQARLEPCAHVISDTYGMAVGESDQAKTPLGVSGRVLVIPFQDRTKYHVGDCVCSAPNGTADIMTREEIIKFPDRIIGIVDEIPEYENWNQTFTTKKRTVSTTIKVNGRIWIYVR